MMQPLKLHAHRYMYLTSDMLLRAGYQLKETFPPAHVGVILKVQ